MDNCRHALEPGNSATYLSFNVAGYALANFFLFLVELKHGIPIAIFHKGVSDHTPNGIPVAIDIKRAKCQSHLKINFFKERGKAAVEQTDTGTTGGHVLHNNLGRPVALDYRGRKTAGTPGFATIFCIMATIGLCQFDDSTRCFNPVQDMGEKPQKTAIMSIPDPGILIGPEPLHDGSRDGRVNDQSTIILYIGYDAQKSIAKGRKFDKNLISNG